MPAPQLLHQSELSFAKRHADTIGQLLREHRKTRLQRIGDRISTTLIIPFLKGLIALIEATKILQVIPGPVWMIGSMLVSIAIYASHLGWKLAAGFIVLLMIHEIGHLLAGRYYGARMSVPIFIPYIGAIIDMKQPMRNAWEEAVFGISGPVLGTLGACLCWVTAIVTGSFYFAELAFFGLFLNLFNLVPLGFLDGGHVAVALTRWLWPVGFLIMGVFVYFVHSPAAILSLVVMLPMVLSLFKKRTQQQRDYDRVSLGKRLIMGTLYFSLVIFLSCSLSWIFIKEIYPGLKEHKSSSPMALSVNGK